MLLSAGSGHLHEDNLELRDPASFSHSFSPAAIIIHSSLRARAIVTFRNGVTMELPKWRSNNAARSQSWEGKQILPVGSHFSCDLMIQYAQSRSIRVHLLLQM